jgi:hypothetical protein
MEIALLLFVLLVAVGAVASGSDSRLDEAARRRRYLG